MPPSDNNLEPTEAPSEQPATEPSVPVSDSDSDVAHDIPPGSTRLADYGDFSDEEDDIVYRDDVARSDDTEADEDQAAEPSSSTESAAESEPDELAALRERAERWDRYEEYFAQNPALLVANHLKHLTPDERSEVFRILQSENIEGVPGPDDADSGSDDAGDIDYDGLTEQEVWVEKNKRTIEGIAEHYPAFTEVVREGLSAHGALIDDAILRTTVLEQQIAYLADLLKATLPSVKTEDVWMAFRDDTKGEQTIADIVRSLMQPERDKAAARTKQSSRQRPDTPGNSSGARRGPNSTRLLDFYLETLGPGVD